jgi:hypothetical protein
MTVWSKATQNSEKAQQTNLLYPKISSSNEDYEVAFLTSDSPIDHKAFEFALRSAEFFDSRLVLVYLAQREEVPQGYLEFAKREGIRDYEWQYYNWLAGERLGQLGSEADDAGIAWSVRVHIGDVESAATSLTSDKRTIVVINTPAVKGTRSGFLSKYQKPQPVKVWVY